MGNELPDVKTTDPSSPDTGFNHNIAHFFVIVKN